jgi:hypothetical protein
VAGVNARELLQHAPHLVPGENHRKRRAHPAYESSVRML